MIAKILVCDDDPDVRALLKDLLEANRHRVIEATDGAQAFAMAEEHRPHLIIMDVVMPGLYGTSASKRLKDYKGTAGIPILIFSGTVDQAVIDKIGISGDNVVFLKKPSEPKIILETIRKMLPEGGYTR